MKANIDQDIGRKTFASGLLPELIAVLGRSRPGDLVALIGDEASVGPELETWCRFTGNSLLEATVEEGRARRVFRCGAVALPPEEQRPLGSRLWLYTNFDCNLRCDYCCVRSSPTAARRELGLERVRRIPREAKELAVKEIFVTGGEPFLLEDIGEILIACSATAPTTVLTNGMLFTGRRTKSLQALPRDRVVLQISLDSATPNLRMGPRGPATPRRVRRTARSPFAQCGGRMTAGRVVGLLLLLTAGLVHCEEAPAPECQVREWPGQPPLQTPAGFRAVTDQEWTTLKPDSWDYLRRTSSKNDAICQDAANARSALEIVFTPDMAANTEPSVHWLPLPAANAVYAAWFVRH